MSHTQYFANSILNAVKEIVDGAQLSLKEPTVYQTLMNNVFTQGSQLQNHLFAYLDQQTNGGWRQGIHQQTLEQYLRAWIREAIAFIVNTLQQNRMNMQPMMQPMMQPTNPTSSIYNSPIPVQQQPVFQPQQGAGTMRGLGVAPQTVDSISTEFDLGSDVVLSLRKTPLVDIPKTAAGGALEFDNYQTGDHERDRLVTIDTILRLAQNKAVEAGRIVYDIAPQEVIRGLFANVIRYYELFHIPVGYQQFRVIAEEVGKAYYNKEKTDWRTAIEALSARPRAEWRIINDALCQLLNSVIHLRLRTTDGAMIESIDTLDDLNILDDRNSTLTVTKHSNYWSIFNSLVTAMIDRLFNPKSLINPSDPNFGDFIQCQNVRFYFEGRSKYDYGTFVEMVDKTKFIEQMMATNTVLRVPKAIILTNAIDPRLITQLRFKGKNQGILTRSVHTVGTSLLEKLDYPKRDTIDKVICFEKNVHPDQYCEVINLGRTLDNDLILLG